MNVSQLHLHRPGIFLDTQVVELIGSENVLCVSTSSRLDHTVQHEETVIILIQRSAEVSVKQPNNLHRALREPEVVEHGRGECRVLSHVMENCSHLHVGQ